MSLWAHFMHSKYQHTDFITQKRNDSYIWKSMVGVLHVAQDNIFWRLGSGKLYFWPDAWFKPLQPQMYLSYVALIQVNWNLPFLIG